MATVTYGDLLAGVQSTDPAERKRALDAFNAWVKLAPTLPADQRLTHMQCELFRRVASQQSTPPQARRA